MVLYIFPSHFIFVQVLCKFWKSCCAVWRFDWELKISWDHLDESHWPSTSCPPTPHSSADIWEEPYILSPEKEFRSTQCCCHSVLWCTGSHLIIIIINSINNNISLFIIAWERVSWLFFRLSLCRCLSRPLGFLQSFSDTPLSFFGHC
jgi:hypothetical protein